MKQVMSKAECEITFIIPCSKQKCKCVHLNPSKWWLDPACCFVLCFGMDFLVVRKKNFLPSALNGMAAFFAMGLI